MNVLCRYTIKMPSPPHSLQDPAVTHSLYKYLTPASLLTMRTLSRKLYEDSALSTEVMARTALFERGREHALAFLFNVLYALLLANPRPPIGTKAAFGFQPDVKPTSVIVSFQQNIIHFKHNSSELSQTFNPRTEPRAVIRDNLVGFLHEYLNNTTPRVYGTGASIVGFSITTPRQLPKSFVDTLLAATRPHDAIVKFRKPSPTQFRIIIDCNFISPAVHPHSRPPPPYEPPLTPPKSKLTVLQRDSAVRAAIDSTGVIGTAESQSLLSRRSLTQRMDRTRDETIALVASLRLR